MAIKVPITEYLHIDVDEEMWYCNRCGYKLISARENYKKGCLVYDRDPRTLYEPVTELERDYTGNPELCRLVEFYCPNCGVMVDVEVLLLGHPITYDIELDIDKLKQKYGRGE